MASVNAEVPHLLQEAVNYSMVAGIMLLVYDVIIHLSSEIELIWLCRWSLGKVMYLLARYSAFVDASVILYYSFSVNLTTESCRTPYDAGVWCMTIGIAICHCVLILRTYAIWERSAVVLTYICLTQVAAVTIKAYMVTEALKSVTFTPSPMPIIAACLPSLGTNISNFTYCIDVALEFQLLCLSLSKGFFQWKCDSTPLFRTLHRDGFIYFAVLFCISLTNTIVNTRMFNAPYSAIVIL
ncbi:hypothetical protein SCHPADRAFT_941238 [Schizopora paradoxa]|uniref:DUF6533 domain-containing protein n=1 Tax=Schizopora paradoxa TaxID=27342 RepID=A0A0H2RKB2_9AGAM|nr:hypothetical protein SCHPADRAFT_941238 [Schizopora paradoxa]